MLHQHAGQPGTRELRALIRVEDLRSAVLRQSHLQRRDAERCFHSDNTDRRSSSESHQKSLSFELLKQGSSRK